MQHRLLVLGSMDEFVELVRLAQKRGYYVISCDGYEGGKAKQIADAGYTIDVRDIDAIARVCQDESVDGIITSFSDLMAECMVKIAEKTGLPTYAASERFRYLREKPLMKQMFAELGVPTAQSVRVSRDSIARDIEPIGFPCVVKPADGYGSRGIYVLRDAEEVAKRFDEIASYSTLDYILAEQYVSGYEFNMMNWLVDGEVHTLGIADREKFSEIPHAIPHVCRNVYPTRFMDQVYEDAREIVRKVAEYVGIKTGPISMQFFWNPDEGIHVCEVAGRLLGYEHELITIASGFSIEELLLNYVYDRDAMRAMLNDHSALFDKCSAVLYFHGHERTIGDFSIAEDAVRMPGVVDTSIFYEVGDTVRHGVGALPYVLRSYIEADSRAQLDAITQQLFDTVKVLDVDGRDLLYANRMVDYDGAVPDVGCVTYSA